MSLDITVRSWSTVMLFESIIARLAVQSLRLAGFLGFLGGGKTVRSVASFLYGLVLAGA